MKQEKRKFTDNDYKLINNFYNNTSPFVNKPLKEFFDYLKEQEAIFERIKTEYSVGENMTLKELDDKIKEE